MESGGDAVESEIGGGDGDVVGGEKTSSRLF